ncbi:MAG: heme ABC exporter ATP-binding protein CcmA [Thermoanaerobaculia bacterium]
MGSSAVEDSGPASSIAIEAKALSRRYGRRWALVEASFQVPRGRALMVAGRNGSGKTTLLRTLATAIRPDAGTARIEGHDIVRERDAVRRATALLSHATYTYEALSAIENLRIAARILGRDAGGEVLTALLDQVGLAGRAADPVASYSAGMRKRLAIARVLLQEAAVVLLDEPYGQLDPPGFRFVDHLVEVSLQRGATVVVSTHQLERGAALCDDGIVLENGLIVWRGPAGELPASGGVDPATLREP